MALLRSARRRLAVAIRVVALLATSACGFHPVYAVGGGPSARAASSLAAIQVGPIPERPGQLLRLALQERFERFGGASSPRYALRADVSIESDLTNIAEDSSITRIRLVGRSTYTLVALDTQRTVTSGTARAVDGFDILNQQYFAADLTNEATVRRLADALADQVALQLATYFSAHGVS